MHYNAAGPLHYPCARAACGCKRAGDWLAVGTVFDQGCGVAAVPAVWTSDGPQETGLLAKPSVRYRKTINVMDRYGNDMGVGAQHYAVLVTDVQQWPYPELQL